MKTKRLILIFLLTMVPALSVRAQYVSLGVGAGSDGISAEVAARLGGHVQVRAGYGYAPGLMGVTINRVKVPEHPGLPNESSVTVPLTLKLGTNEGRFLFDIFPSSGGFHFTVGAHMGSPRLIRGTLKGLPSVYNIAGLMVDGYIVKATGGVLEAMICGKGLGSERFAFKPYVGVGYGRAVKEDSRVSFSVDLGVQYQGKPYFQAQGETVTGRKQNVTIPNEVLDNLAPGFSEKADKYLGWMVVWPTLSAHLYVKLF